MRIFSCFEREGGYLPTFSPSEFGYKRYKLITQVTIGEMKGQAMRIGSRCLWDVNTDHCASDVLQNVSVRVLFSNIS